MVNWWQYSSNIILILRFPLVFRWPFSLIVAIWADLISCITCSMLCWYVTLCIMRPTLYCMSSMRHVITPQEQSHTEKCDEIWNKTLTSDRNLKPTHRFEFAYNGIYAALTFRVSWYPVTRPQTYGHYIFRAKQSDLHDMQHNLHRRTYSYNISLQTTCV